MAPKYLNRSANAQARANDGSKYGIADENLTVIQTFYKDTKFDAVLIGGKAGEITRI